MRRLKISIQKGVKRKEFVLEVMAALSSAPLVLFSNRRKVCPFIIAYTCNCESSKMFLETPSAGQTMAFLLDERRQGKMKNGWGKWGSRNTNLISELRLICSCPSEEM